MNTLYVPNLRVTVDQFLKCFGDTSSSPCSAMVEEHQTVVGSCLLLMGTPPACRHTPSKGASVVMPEHKSCPGPTPMSALKPSVGANVSAGSQKVPIW